MAIGLNRILRRDFTYRFGRRPDAIRAPRRPRPSVAFGSVRELTPIMFPIVLSQAIDVLMVFCDRLFLAQVGKEQLAATLSGGILTFMITTLVTGTLGQVNPLVAQYRGAGRHKECTQVVHQGLIFAVFFAPAIFLVARVAAPALFGFFNHGGVLLSSELEYFHILSFTIFAASIRQVFANFFIGIGETRIVTAAAFSAVIVNIPLAYALTFGAWGFPRMEIRGAAWATVLSGFLPVVILVWRFFSVKLSRAYGTHGRLVLRKEILLKLMRYGMPAGVETFVNVGGFTFFTLVLYSYSADVAAATTIVLNWDMVSFLPLTGISQAASSLVGRYLGAGRKKLALRSAWSGLKMGWIYASMITLLYFSATSLLVRLFSQAEKPQEFLGVESVATVMLKISCLYFFFDATYAVLGGILRGAGDTVWAMFVTNATMWSGAVATYIMKERVALTAVGAWIILTVMVFGLGIVFFTRFQRKKWLHRLMIA